MIRRTFDASFLNRVANDPSVRPWLGKDGEGRLDSAIDFQPLIERGAIALENEWGGFMLASLAEPGAYELHTQFLPEGRGRRAHAAAMEAGAILFDELGVETIYTQCPDNNPAALFLARLMGFVEIAPRASAWRAAGGIGKDMALTRAQWRAKPARRAGRVL